MNTLFFSACGHTLSNGDIIDVYCNAGCVIICKQINGNFYEGVCETNRPGEDIESKKNCRCYFPNTAAEAA